MSDSNASAAFNTLNSDPHGEWEEDPDFDSCIDLENMPECSQDLARELLHQDEERDISDSKHERFL